MSQILHRFRKTSTADSDPIAQNSAIRQQSPACSPKKASKALALLYAL